ncbi:MAG: hypothetical protein KC468_27925, partial [Myxococcales bacterium]|nr:hypothetical protein [Myxococcales bacterium]
AEKAEKAESKPRRSKAKKQASNKLARAEHSMEASMVGRAAESTMTGAVARRAARRPRRRRPRKRGPYYPLLPIFGFALLGLALTAGVLALILQQDLRHVVIDRPWWLLTAALPVLALLIRQAVAPRPATLQFSRTLSARRLRPGFAAHLAWLPDGLRLAAALLLAAALARPQS